MQMIRKLAAMAVCISCALSALCSCEGKSSDESQQTTTNVGIDDGVEPVIQETVTYEFPSFLSEDQDSISLYSNLVYSSFDSPAMNVALSEESQPFGSVSCEISFLSGTYYSYISGSKRGILNADGNIMVPANYTEIALVRPDTFLLTKENGEEKYAYIEENGVITVDEDGSNSWFTSEAPVQIKTAEDNENATLSYYLESARGRTIYSQYWDYIEPVTLDIPSTASYSAYSGDAYYYIVFDKYYNYKIYEGSYATVEVYVGGQYGSCFILSIDDFNEITSMIDSFGSSSKPVTAPTDPGTDYVKFVFGNTKSTVTISSDGFCYTEEINSEDGVSYKYFTVVDKLCFADVVKWIDSELSQEYI